MRLRAVTVLAAITGLLAGSAAVPALASGAAVPAGRSPGGHGTAGGTLSAQIRYTTGGIPHILAHDWASLGFGYGYAFAKDNICTMAGDYVTVEAQRSRYFGPNGSYAQRGNGVVVGNLDSDIFFRQIIDSGVVQRLAKQLSPAEQAVEAGYVRGYNAYLAHVGGSAGVPDPSCRGQAWVKPITTFDSYLRFYQLMLLSSSDVVIQGITGATPPKAGTGGAGTKPGIPGPVKAGTSTGTWGPGNGGTSTGTWGGGGGTSTGTWGGGGGTASADRPAGAHLTAGRPPAQLARTAGRLAAAFRAQSASMGSNAVAIGSAGTRDHRGLLLGNPHFPWIGPERFYQSQLTIPGKIDVTGASLYGVPLILIGHNASVAWSHTVSTAFRFTPYQLTLVPGHPTEYMLDGKAVAMTPRTVTVMAKQSNGTLAPVTRTLWWTRYGPVFNNLQGITLPWDTSVAFAFADANAGNLARAVNTWFNIDRASSTEQVLTILKKYEGIPWVNTIATDRAGTALYADIGTIPHVSNAEAHACDTPLGKLTFSRFGLPILDGSRTACDWATDPHSAVPGIFGAGHEPYLLRLDYVTNSNDSYWLSNPHQPLTGFARIIGTEQTARTLRTRIGLIDVQARISGTDGQGRPGFTVAAMRNLDLSDIDYAAVLTRPALVKLCQQFQAAGGTAPTSNGGTVRLGDACATLAHWNLRWDAAQRGAVLFGTFWAFASAATPSPFSHPFELSHPVTTPNGLDTSNAAVRNALGDAIQALHKAHVPIDTTLGAVQFVGYHGSHITIPGGPGDPDGIYNAIYEHTEPGDSHTSPDTGSSFIQVVTWPKTGTCPVGSTILTYSESANPASPHFADQTKLFSKKQWLPDRFCQFQIAADPNLQVTTVTAPAG